MPRLAANLSMLFQDHDFLDRYRAAARAGFKGVEFLFPYAWPAQEIQNRLGINNLELVLFNIHPGDWDAGERGLAALKDRQSQFQEAAHQAIEYANALECKRIHAMAGLIEHGAEQGMYKRNLKWFTKLAEPHGIDILIEPINTRDMPGYLLNTAQQACNIIRDVGAPNLGLQLDLYHRHVQEGDALRAIRDNAQHIRHVQIAGPPDRGEPYPSDFDAASLLKCLDDIGYDGWVGCEYRPRGDTLAGLSWITQCGLQLDHDRS